jgi:Na+/H+-dicarboxylate symporter
MSLTVRVLISIDTIPDMFRTATNVTGHMTAAAILARSRAAALVPVSDAPTTVRLPEGTTP